MPTVDPLAVAHVRQFHPSPAYSEQVQGAIVGPVSTFYSATLCTVEVWPRHGVRSVYPPRVHTFTAEEGQTVAAALAAYCANHRREFRLGDGSPCVLTLEPVEQVTKATSR